MSNKKTAANLSTAVPASPAPANSGGTRNPEAAAAAAEAAALVAKHFPEVTAADRAAGWRETRNAAFAMLVALKTRRALNAADQDALIGEAISALETLRSVNRSATVNCEGTNFTPQAAGLAILGLGKVTAGRSDIAKAAKALIVRA